MSFIFAFPCLGFVQSWTSSILSRKQQHFRIRAELGADDQDRAEKIKKMMMEESMDPASMAATAQRMKSMRPEELDILISELDKMGEVEKKQLASMGMNPEMMKMSMKMMRDNPSIMQSAQKMMEKMTPEEMVSLWTIR